MKRRFVKDLYWGAVFVLVGGLFLARNLGYIDFYFTWRTYWPVILIVIGGSIIVKPISRNNT